MTHLMCEQCRQAKLAEMIVVHEGFHVCVLCVLVYFSGVVAHYTPEWARCRCGGIAVAGQRCGYCGGRGQQQPVAP